MHGQSNQVGTTSRDGPSNSEPESESTHNESVEYVFPPVITDLMDADQILNIFQPRGVPNLTPNLDLSTINYPVVGGHRARLLDGSLVAVESRRICRHDNEHRTLKHIAHELYIWSRCKHPNILELIGAAHVRKQIAFIFPWVENGTVSQFITNNPGAPRYELCAQLAAAVSYLHHVGVVHGEINGSNVLVSTDLTIKLGSIGNAIRSNHSICLSCAVGQALVGHAFLSIRYAAPELLMNDHARPTLFTDVYSLGMTILEIISGSIPHRDVRRDICVLRKILNGIPPNRPEELAKDDTRANILWPLLLKCWSYDPSKRPAASDVLEVMNALSAMG